MPVYLLHGFRWPRDGFTGIRVYGVVHDLDDWSNNYIQNDNSRAALLVSFRKSFPSIMSRLEDEKTGRSIHFIEPYDPEDLDSESAVCSKYAFIADRVITMAAGLTLPLEDVALQSTSIPIVEPDVSQTSSSNASTLATNPHSDVSPANSSPIPHRNPAVLFMNVEEAISSGSSVDPHATKVLAELRDEIAGGEKIGWWIVYNGDPERAFDLNEDEEDYEAEEGNVEEAYDEEGARTPTQARIHSEFNFLNLPTPSLLPPELKGMHFESSDTPPTTTATGQSLQQSTLSEKPHATSEVPNTNRSKRSKSFSLPLRKKSSKANLPTSKAEHIPDPPALKEINKKEGFRHKFFGRRGDKE